MRCLCQFEHIVKGRKWDVTLAPCHTDNRSPPHTLPYLLDAVVVNVHTVLAQLDGCNGVEKEACKLDILPTISTVRY